MNISQINDDKRRHNLKNNQASRPLDQPSGDYTNHESATSAFDQYPYALF